MHKIVTLVAAATFALTGTAIAQTAAPAAAPAAAAATAAKLEKPASVAQAAWDKMTDAQKKDAVDKAKAEASKAAPAAAAPAKKEKKGGC